MSNDNEIYPLKEFNESDGPLGRQRSVNQRLAPIFKALLDDPDGWEYEYELSEGWTKFDGLPEEHADCDNFRLTPKRKTINKAAEWWADWLLDAVAAATQDRRFLRGDDEYDDVAGEAILRNAEKAIRSAMEGK